MKKNNLYRIILSALILFISLETYSQICLNKIACGWRHCIALDYNDTCYVWGTNYYGELGINSTVKKKPFKVAGFSQYENWDEISAGYYYSMVVKNDGTLWGFGRNDFGQLGNGTNINEIYPVQIGSDTNWSKVYCGYSSTFAIKKNGTLWSWGYNTNGELGLGFTGIYLSTPTQIGNDTNWIEIAVGYSHILGKKSDSTIWSWGQNNWGQLGDGTFLNKNIPTQIGVNSKWLDVISNLDANTSFGLKSDGTLWAWGDNNSGVFGNNTYTSSNIPIQIGLDTNWHIVVTGSDHTLAIKKDGTLWAWGNSVLGQLGLGAGIGNNYPMQVGISTDWMNIYCNSQYSIGTKTNGELYVWGKNTQYQLGDSTTINKVIPTLRSSACLSPSCITWQSSPPTASNILTATNYLCTNSIIQNSQNAITNQGAILRHDFAKIIYKGLLGSSFVITPADSFTSPFYDLQDTTVYYYKYAKALCYLEYGDGISPFSRTFAHFRPSESILRKDAMKVFAEAWNLPRDFSGTSPFTDVQTTDANYSWIKAMYNAGVISGGTFDPNGVMTRDSAFLVLYRMLTTLTKPIPTNTDYYHPYNLTPNNMDRVASMDEGNFSSYSKNSFNINGLMPLNFTHSFNAMNLELPEEYFYKKTLVNGVVYDQNSLSEGWSHNYNSYLIPIFGDSSAVNTDDRILIHWGDGRNELYKLPPVSGQPYIAEYPSNYNILTHVGIQFVLTTKSQMKYYFQIGGGNTFIASLVKIEDRNGNEINLTYTFNGNVPLLNTVIEPSGRALNFFYSNASFPNLITSINAVTGSINRTVFFVYNSNGKLITYTDPKGQNTQYLYDTISGQTDLLKKIILPKGNIIDNTYDNRKLTSSKFNNTYQTNISPTTNYLAGKATTAANTSVTRNGQTLSYQINRNNNGAVDSINGMGIHFKAEYNDVLNPTLPTKVYNLLNTVTASSTFDNKGNLLTLVKSDGTNTITETNTYNTFNDLTSHIDGNGNTINYVYTGANLTAIQKPIGTANFNFNSNGTIASTTNPSGIATTMAYNTYGNLSSTTLAGIITSQIAYDDASRVVSTTNPMNVVTNYSYDANDNRTNETFDPSSLNIITNYAFDQNDNLTDITNALGGITSLSFNTEDQLTQQSFGGNSKLYEYNEDGTLKKFTSQNGVPFTQVYNSDGNVTNDGYSTTTYHADKTIATISSASKTLSYTYDAFKRIASVSYNDFVGNTVSYQYDNNSNITQINYPNNSYIVKYTYDANNRMTSVKDGANNILATYTYFTDGRLQLQTNANGTSTEYTYDVAGRMIGQSTKNSSNAIIASYTFSLDNNGNHTQETSNIPNNIAIPTIGASLVSGTYTNNRTNIYAGETFTHDANGNVVTTSNSLNYTWDTKDNLLTYLHNGITTTYEYDPLEARRKRNANHFVLDPLNNNNVLMETDANGNPTSIYVHGLGLVCRVAPSTNALSFYHYDFRGSTVAITDASQTVTHRYAYGAFGEDYGKQEIGFNNSFRYVGKYGVMYEDSILQYMRARYYNPELGRFIGEDPVWGTNLFPYCSNNPVNFIDPMGSDFQSAALTANASQGKLLETKGDIDDYSYNLLSAYQYQREIVGELVIKNMSNYENYLKNKINLNDLEASINVLEKRLEGLEEGSKNYNKVNLLLAEKDQKRRKAEYNLEIYRDAYNNGLTTINTEMSLLNQQRLEIQKVDGKIISKLLPPPSQAFRMSRNYNTSLKIE